MSSSPLQALLSTVGAAPTHSLGAWVMAAILGASLLGILLGAIAVTTRLDRSRQAHTERRRQEPPSDSSSTP